MAYVFLLAFTSMSQPGRWFRLVTGQYGFCR
jgi:hypothetical protein